MMCVLRCSRRWEIVKLPIGEYHNYMDRMGRIHKNTDHFDYFLTVDHQVLKCFHLHLNVCLGVIDYNL